jgi:hypothetical protein
MAQSDQVVQNATFPTVRADINDNLAALYSQNSGNSAPAVTVAFQPWVDTSSSPPVWKVRNGSNTAWITIGVLDPAGFNAGGVTAIANGGTGATTAALALAALLPSQSGNAGKALVTSGSAASWGVVASGASIQVFTANGTYTPTAGKTTFLVFATGGGGGGGTGSFGGSGGGAGTAVNLYSTGQLGSSASLTVGAGGTAAATGGTSSFTCSGTGGSMSATGGGGASGGPRNELGGSAGTTSGTLSFGLTGQKGIVGTTLINAGSGTNAQSAIPPGGASFWGGGYGCGGNGPAGTGVSGFCLILEW